jgi:NitT/TauT family transport system ATP-binding protein
MQAAIRVENLTKVYSFKNGKSGCSSLPALDNVSLSVRRGEFFALLGPSGCGKSTLLHIIGGIVPATGSIFIGGKSVSGPGLDRGVVFQEYALFPWRTALGNVEFGLEIKGVSKDKRSRIAREHLSLVGLEGFEDKYPYQLSGGMKQRVAIARALAYDPDVLLMDEPFAALDTQTRETLQCELLRIWEKTGKTIIFVTHSIEEAAFLAEKVAVMTARPGTIKRIVDIPLPKPRYTERDIRSSAQFALVRHKLWELLSEEVDRSKRETDGLQGFAAAYPERSSKSPVKCGFKTGAFSQKVGEV